MSEKLEKYKIISLSHGYVMFSGGFPNFRLCVEGALKTGVDLSGADLHNADLRGADLSFALLRGASLCGADLSNANLVGTDLSGATLSYSNFRGAHLVKKTRAISLDRRATRSDSYEFFLWRTNRGWRVRAGCRFFTLDEAWEHWETTRADTPLGDESLDILTMFQLHVDRVEGNQ